MSQVHCTSFAVNGCPSCQRTPSRSRRVSSVPSSFHDQPVARSGTIHCNVFCGTCWSNMTRLLNTAIIGATVEIVTSSRVDMLAGLSRWATWSTPPGFCANAVLAARNAISSAAVATSHGSFRIICPSMKRQRPIPFGRACPGDPRLLPNDGVCTKDVGAPGSGPSAEGPRVICGWPPARKDFFTCLHRRPIAVMCPTWWRGARPQALMGSVDRDLIKPAGPRCPMTRDRYPSIGRLTGPRA